MRFSCSTAPSERFPFLCTWFSKSAKLNCIVSLSNMVRQILQKRSLASLLDYLEHTLNWAMQKRKKKNRIADESVYVAQFWFPVACSVLSLTAVRSARTSPCVRSTTASTWHLAPFRPARICSACEVLISQHGQILDVEGLKSRDGEEWTAGKPKHKPHKSLKLYRWWISECLGCLGWLLYTFGFVFVGMNRGLCGSDDRLLRAGSWLAGRL